MQSVEGALAEYEGLPKHGLHVAEWLAVQEEVTYPEVGFTLSLRIRFMSREPGDPRRLHLAFHGVRNLRIAQPEGAMLSGLYLDIRDIRNRQWEGIAFEVVETEEDVIHFICRSFEARIGEG
ncbi:MAG TPA: hypothetical protein VGM37_04780 [Armatimonadota bacterium]|jgi:hypothetical protein